MDSSESCADITSLEDMLAKSLSLEDNPNPTTAEDILNTITNYFRELRAVCAKGKMFQDAVAESNIIKHSTEIVQKLLNDPRSLQYERVLVCVRVGVQFFGNFVVDNDRTRSLMWQEYKNLLRELLNLSDVRASNYTAMVVFNIFKGNPNIPYTDITNVFPSILSLAAKESEFALYCVEHLISWPGFIAQVYPVLGVGERLFLLEVCREMTGKGAHLPPDTVMLISTEFKKKADIIFVAHNGLPTPDPSESAALLEAVATASGIVDSEGAAKLQQDGALLTSAVFLLRGIHACMSVEDKLSAFDARGDKMQEIKQSPMYGFKAQLVRLIGNLCFRNKINQDKLRDMEGVPLLLNCSRLDACNPFITQWVILAIRNICEGNPENQALISSLSKEGDQILQNGTFRLNPDANGAMRVSFVESSD
ncbi:ataxin-10 [Neocloeon triangulifer]|uniref:ataxin-10 n=1 Tax=Neocloeon triangulifer TaxID=2078957 RepID=UPI00286FA245|nr:ataxin-10 [Neocloeon triangulifer]